MTEPEQRGWMRSFGVLVIFAGVGPLVGSIVVYAWIGVSQALTAMLTGQWAQGLEMVAFAVSFGVLFTLPLGYVLGLVPALAVGLAVLWWERRSARGRQGLSARVAVVAASIFWVAVVFFRGVSISGSWDAWIGAGSSFSALVVSAWVCTRIARRVC
ncbi:hypothetical protein [Orrella marina]|uniref:Uncharacterized protein n=1 Tax=Orrella marina TaxID=2163011 RepID=A0A2R4XNN7_9BURK|nr:hypothetical protein [Orrella marina]AWB35384.1 hypothetical protein DBV39_18390 [Orrella marina]